MLNRQNNFDNAFDDFSISNCAVEIFDYSSDTLILNNNNIINYSYKGVNSYIAFSYPYERLTVNFKDYKSLSNAQKGYLTKGNFLYVVYWVNGKKTTTKKVFCVESIEVDRKKESAVLTCKGILETLTNLVGDYSWASSTNATNPTFTYKTMSQMFQTFTNSLSSYATIYSSMSNDINANGVPTDLTRGELLQNIAMTQGGNIAYIDGAIRVANYGNIWGGQKTHFNAFNIYNDYSIKESDNDYSSVVVNGYGESPIKSITSAYRESSGGVYVAKALFETNTKWKLISASSGGNFSWNVSSNVVSQFQGATLYPITVNYTEKTFAQSTGDTVIQSYFIGATDTTTVNLVQSKVRGYFANKRFIEFECRINPAIEPLDYIKTDHVCYFVEEVEINFNGGFTGKIKGRVDDTVIAKPTITINSNTGSTFSFTIKNNADRTVYMYIYANGQITGSQYSFSAGQSQTFTESDYPSLVQYFTDYLNNELEQDVYCIAMESGDWLESEPTTILEANA